MKSVKLYLFFVIANLIIINGVIIAYLYLNYPWVGSDYSLTIPGMLDTALHFRLNGLVIQWFTPSFGGGIPAFPDPNNGQFSLLAFLAIFLPPLQAVALSVIFYVSAGFIACEYFLRHTLKINWTSSTLGAVIFSANGLIIQRVAIGHLGFETFPLLAVFLIALLDESLQPMLSGAIMGLTLGILVYFAGYFVIIIFSFSIIIALPILYIYNPAYFKWKRWLAVLGLGGAIGLIISASKLAAIYSFMRFFPRSISDAYHRTQLQGLYGLALQLLGTMNLAPFFQITGLNPDSIQQYFRTVTGAHSGYWEFDMSISPVVFGILLAGLIVYFRHPKKYLSPMLTWEKITAFVLLFLFLVTVAEFTLARGRIYLALRHLPILSSLHVNVRFAAAFIFPLALVATLIYHNWVRNQSLRKSFFIFVITNILAILPLGSYFLFKVHDRAYNDRAYNISTGQMVYEEIQAGETLDVTNIGLQNDNTEALLSGSSNLHLYDPVFGYKLQTFHPEVTPGSIWNTSHGYFNMTDPTGFVYPEINGNRPFERFRVEDKDMLSLFARHIQPNWKIPAYQHVLDWISGSTFLIALAYLLFHTGKRLFFKKT